MELTPSSNLPGNVLLKLNVAVVNDVRVIRQASRFEGEHGVLAQVYQSRFEATRYHQDGGHPIMPAPDEDAEEVTAIHIENFCVIPVQ